MKAVVTLLILVICLNVQAQSKFVENTHYTVVSDHKTAKPEVKEFFSLFCSHCFQFEVFMDSIKDGLPNGIELKKSHVSYLPKGDAKMQELIMKAYIIMQELDIDEELSKQFFAAIHVKGMEFKTMADLKEIFVANGVSEARFDNLMMSSEVEKKAMAMAKLWQDKDVQSVPTIVVNGKYRINLGRLKTIKELVELTNELIVKD